MEIVLVITQIASCITALVAALSVLIKPIRERWFQSKRSIEGEKCLLRSEMLRIYYKNLDSRVIHQFEMENFLKLYDAYKALGGNSFIEEVHEEVSKWTIIK
mgnify:CR=1 FL=1